MTKLSDAKVGQLALLKRVGATHDHPAFGEDFGEINYRVVNQLVRDGLAGKARMRRYGGGLYAHERQRIGFWPTAAGLAALKETENG